MQNNEAHITWHLNENGDPQPYSSLFNDVYFSSDDGLNETEYVFLQGNDLTERFNTLNHFTIIETGFGTGLNFLCAAQLWLNIAPAQATLHFISVEKYPLSLYDLVKALQLFPSLQPLAADLIAQYPQILSGKTISLFNQRVKLTLMIGDASQCLSGLQHKADAWFLDGFAPAKNPDMWGETLFAQMARLSHVQTTFATFTSAGAVRRGLQAAGFKVNKRAGFGKKREMLHGCFTDNFSLGKPFVRQTT
jgi:tRNA U34 5-methylaminomethyl-2-thiouridine-forming methyltransferase MnmC